VNDHFCGGSIFSDFYIITAAHCVDNESPYDVQIVAGIHNRSDPNGVVRQVEQIHIHPNWTSSSRAYLHDIALLRLSHPLNLRTNPLLTRVCVSNVQLPTYVENYPANGTRLTAIGWGNIRQSVFDNSPDNLHQVQIFTIDNNDPSCNKSLYDKEVQFCAADYEGGKGWLPLLIFLSSLLRICYRYLSTYVFHSLR
jgi:secreted trypsin-like serine protease